jgi:hypothetical protein
VLLNNYPLEAFAMLKTVKVSESTPILMAEVNVGIVFS